MSAHEFQIQKAICETLAIAYPQVMFAAVPNGAVLCASNDPAGRQRAKREIAKLKITGLRPGFPDLFLSWPGGFGTMEIKSEAGRLSPEQVAVQKQLKAHGHKVAVCRSIEDLIETMAGWGVEGRIT